MPHIRDFFLSILCLLSLSAEVRAQVPVSVAINALMASPATVEPGQTVTFSAVLTADQTVTGFPVEFSWLPPGSWTGTNTVVFANYQAGQSVTETASWTVPDGATPGTYTLWLGVFDPAWDVPALNVRTITFSVGVASASGSGSTELPGPNAALFAKPYYTCLRNFYVATTGNDANSGTQASPWLTIQHADSPARQAGDCINVASGIYEANILIQNGGNAPTPTGYVAYRCETLDGCHVLAPGGGHLWGIEQPANFIVIDGFEIDGNDALQRDGIADGCIASDGATYGAGHSSHHIWVLNNIIHHCNLAGISFNNKEWYYVIDNMIYHNAWTSGYQGSGISFVVVQCIESGNPSCTSGNPYAGSTGAYIPSGMDLTFAPPFHNVVSGNVVFDNMIAANNPVACGSHTDGNGIIMDTFLDETTLSIVYPYRTLITGNISYANGGGGVHVFRTSNVTVANNTVYGNGTDTCINAYYLGDLSQAGGSNNVWVNNVAQSVLTAANYGCGQYCGNRNAPLVAGDSAGIVDVGNVYLNNVTYGGLGVQLFNNDVGYFSCLGNKCETNPLFANPTAENFALTPGSPAIGYGLLESYLPAWVTDAGACPSAFSVCP